MLSVRIPLIALVMGIAALGQAHAQFVTASPPCLPPLHVNAGYVSQYHTTFTTGLGTIDLSNVVHSAFTSCAPPPTGGATVIDSGNSTVTADVSIGGGSPIPMLFNPVPMTVRMTHLVSLPGVEVIETEMLALQLVGGGVMIRESPTLQSHGQTTLTDLGGGLTRIDSFFDIFTELSLDNGQSWIPSNGPAHVTLTDMPEPATLGILGLGLLALTARRRRR
jgi:hypothetical protein